MREFNKVSPKVWRDRKFRALPSNDARLLFVYLITCEHQNSSGCFRLPDGYAVHDLGWEASIYSEKLAEVEASGLVITDAETSEVFICEWFETNPAMSKKHAIGIERIISNIESDKLRELAEAEFVTSRAGIEPQTEGKSGLEALHRGVYGGLENTEYMRRRA